MSPSEFLKKLQKIQLKVKKADNISIIHLTNFNEYIVEYIPTTTNKTYKVIPSDPIQKKRAVWAKLKRKQRAKNPELVKEKARLYYHQNKEKVLKRIYANRKKRKDGS